MISIRDFQQMMKTLYLPRDQQRGETETFNWFQDEVIELKIALHDNNSDAIEEELADVIAWLASLANLRKIDLETAVLKKYNYVCPKCDLSPCRCPTQ